MTNDILNDILKGNNILKRIFKFVIKCVIIFILIILFISILTIITIITNMSTFIALVITSCLALLVFIIFKHKFIENVLKTAPGNIFGKTRRITTWHVITTLGILCFIILVVGGEDCDFCYSEEGMLVKLLLCGLTIIGGSVFFTKRYLKFEKLMFKIERQPILDTDETVEGIPFAGDGIIKAERTLDSPYTGTKCVYYHSITEDITEERVKGDKGSHWVVIENIVDYVPFYIQDRRGKLKIDLRNMDDDFSGYKIELIHRNVVNPSDSEIDCEAVLKNKLIEGYRKNEFVLLPESNIFVYGMVEKNKKGELILRECKDHPLIMSRKNKDEYLNDFFKGGSLVYLSHFLAAIGFSIVMISLSILLKIPFRSFIIPFLVGNGIIIGSILFSLYNRIITLVQRAENALSNINIELKRRNDLIPNIVKIVKCYAKYEREINEIIAEARAGIVFSKEKSKDEKNLEIKTFIGVMERYPKLRANENFKAVMRELIDTEERIAYSREFYNRSVMKYNTLIKEFPFIIVSQPIGFKEKKYLTIARGEKAAPKVRVHK